MKLYNVEYATIDLEFVQNDTIDISFSVFKNGTAFDLTEMDITMDVRDITAQHTLIKHFQSGEEITVSGSVFNILSTGFSNFGNYEYDIQIFTGGKTLTIMRGNLVVLKEVTQ